MVDRIPPLGAEALHASLEDPSYSVYLYLGTEADTGWELAQIIYGLLPRLRTYLVEDPEPIADLLAGQTAGALVFGWNSAPFRALDATQATDLRTVIDAVLQARETPR